MEGCTQQYLWIWVHKRAGVHTQSSLLCQLRRPRSKKTSIVTSTSNAQSLASGILGEMADSSTGTEKIHRTSPEHLTAPEMKKVLKNKTDKNPKPMVKGACQRTQEPSERAPNSQI